MRTYLTMKKDGKGRKYMTNRLQKVEKVINNMSDERFNELLNELGVKEKQWVLEIEDWYWAVTDMGKIEHWTWENDEYHNYRLLMKNVFKTREEAITQRDFNFEKAKLIKEIEDSSDEMNWEDAYQDKYFMYYDYDDGTIDTGSGRVYKNQGTTYTTNRVFLENLIANEPERIKKYLFGVR